MGNAVVSKQWTRTSSQTHLPVIQSTLPATTKLKMLMLETLAQNSWLTLTVLGIGFYWLLKKLIERLRISDIQNKAVFISNCDYDCGQLIALKCAQHGFLVYGGFSKLESRRVLEKRAGDANVKLITVPLDMTDEGAINYAVSFVKKDLPLNTKLWALINTPNEQPNQQNNQLNEFKSSMELNYLAEIRCTHAFIPLLKKFGGRIAITKTISEELILRFGNNKVHKTALNSYLQQLSMELQHTKIKIAVFEPGVLKTNFLDRKAIQNRVEQLSRKISLEERQKLNEHKAKIIEHWNDVFERHGLTNSQSIVNAYFHFVIALFPYQYYKCGPSVFLRSIYIFLLNWLQKLKSLVTSQQKEKRF